MEGDIGEKIHAGSEKIMDDKEIEKLLGIKTTGRDDTRADSYNYPYEPTDYCVLSRLAGSGYVGKNNHLIDYGCGKGRVSFYLSYELGCKATGVEIDDRLYNRAVKNLESFPKKAKVNFVCENAVKYDVPDDANRFYLFNPFSVEVLQSVLKKITDSYYVNQREMILFFYFPSDEYVSALMQNEELSFVDEIDCSDMFPSSKESQRERILIFEVG